MASRIPVVRVVRDGGVVSETRCSDAAIVAAAVRELVKGDDREHAYAVLLDGGNRIKAISLVSLGAGDATLMGAREVFRAAVVYAASKVVLAHNHPSGNPEPSREDVAVAMRLRAVGDLLGIPMVDFVVVGETGHVSLAERENW